VTPGEGVGPVHSREVPLLLTRESPQTLVRGLALESLGKRRFVFLVAEYKS
jgi:hypothetical protein